MTKDQLAEQYANEQYPNANDVDAPFTTTGDLHTTCENSFTAGYEAAEKQQDEMMIKFAEWIGLQQTNIKRIGENTWVQIEGENLATRDLLQQFKETLKQ